MRIRVLATIVVAVLVGNLQISGFAAAAPDVTRGLKVVATDTASKAQGEVKLYTKATPSSSVSTSTNTCRPTASSS